jgi:hypothetical protein
MTAPEWFFAAGVGLVLAGAFWRFSGALARLWDRSRRDLGYQLTERELLDDAHALVDRHAEVVWRERILFDKAGKVPAEVAPHVYRIIAVERALEERLRRRLVELGLHEDLRLYEEAKRPAAADPAKASKIQWHEGKQRLRPVGGDGA